jgi:signal transduction histidine kinase
MEKIRLLLVDDEAHFRETIAKRLSKRGITPEQAASGGECLAILDKKPMDVIVLDVKMPGMDGIETLRHIKKKSPRTEVIFLTGHSTTQEGVDGIKSGAFDYLTKPIELEQLLGKIKQAYEKIAREEEKRKEQEFRNQMEQQMIATERLASLGTLATGVAHEINNPLAIIKESVGYLNLLLKKEELAEMPRKADFELGLSKIEKSIERAKRITHQLLGFVRKTEPAVSEFDVKDFLDEAIQLVHREAADKDVVIAQEIAPAAQKVCSDPYQLRQVLINLLTNAVHASDRGGKITVTVKDKGDDVTLTVIDNGQGIPKENLDKIFEPFFSTKSPGQGTGLGLFVTRGILDKLGGKIEVESQIGHGARFCVTLPGCQKIKNFCKIDEENCLEILAKIKGEIGP